VRVLFLACAVCGSLDSERIAEEGIVMCRGCGFVYRNPCVEDAAGIEASGISGDADLTARAIASRVQLERGDCWLDIGSCDGTFAEELTHRLPDVETVLLESDIGLVERAKRRNPRAAVLPSALWEADLPEAAFRLITVRRFDHFFPHHRRDLERLRGLLRPDGTLYIERSIFVDAVGEKRAGNSWFGRDQFVEYLGILFDVVDRVDYDDGGIGVFCRRR
jgi:hypothetical protein